MFHKAFVIVSFCFISFLSYTANDNPTRSARSHGLGNASVTLYDVWSTSNNQAGLAYIKNISAGIDYEERFLVKELSLKSVAVALPLKSGVFGISTSSFGYNLYSENKYGIAFAKSFGTAIAAGIQLDYFNTKIAEGYGSTGIPVVEMGLQARLTKNIILGSHLFNPTKAKLANYNNERIPTIMRLGLAYEFSDKIFVVTEVQKDIVYSPFFKLGIEYKPIKELYLRTGFCTTPAASTFGFGLLLKKLKLDFASSFDSVLGFTPCAGLIYGVE